MVLIFEPWAKEVEHLEFNKNFFKIINKKEKVVYLGDMSQIERMDKYSKNTIFYGIEIKKENKNKVARLKNFFNDLKNCLFCKKIANEYQVEKIYITTALPEIIFITKILLKNYKVEYVMHSYLKNIENPLNILKINTYFRYILSYFNKSKSYIVLGRTIYKNTLLLLPSLKENLKVMNHPYTEKKYQIKKRSDSIIKIGTVGVGNKEKNTHYLFEIEKLLNEKKITNIELYHIGKIDENIIPIKTNVKIPSKDRMLSEKEFNLYLDDLDYVMYFYPKESYSLIASGAIFDAIFRYKNIIALKNDYFQEIFSYNDDVQCLYDSMDEIKKEILKIALKKNHEVCLKSYKKIIKNYSIDNIDII